LELLAPAGSWLALAAAIENGADAVYLGGPAFNARHSAENFTVDMIKKAVEYAHLRDVKLYVTVNTLLHSHEINPVLDYVFELYNLDVDAVILQDLGLLNLLRELLPDLTIHASTQMTVHNIDGVELLAQQGVKRVVLARELALEEIDTIVKNVSIELEMFVHGALCYSYSGQCLFSSLVGGRSGNRGRCAQPCRLPYSLYSERRGQYVREGKYLLSPSDLALIDYLPALNDIGVKSLKIEGRMKRPEYVAVVTRSYRQILDHISNHSRQSDSEVLKQEMAAIFNRNFTPGYLDSRVLRRLSIQRPNNRGVYIGKVVSRNSDGRTTIHLHKPLSIGDGVEIWVPQGKSPAFTVERMEVNGRTANSTVSGDLVVLQVDEKVGDHDQVFKTHDDSLLRSVQSSFESFEYPQIPVDVHVYLTKDKPMRVVYRTDHGHEATAQTVSPAESAQQRPLDETTLADKLGRLGNTPYTLRSLTMLGEDSLIVPFSEINQVRRDAVKQLNESIIVRNPHQIGAAQFHAQKKDYLATALIKQSKDRNRVPQLRVMVSSIEAARQAVAAGADRVYLTLEGLGTHKRPCPDEIRELEQQGSRQGCEIVPALSRILKPGDQFDYTRLIEESGCSQVMAGDLGGINWCRSSGLEFWADYSLNILNPITLKQLKVWGAKGGCASPELKLSQLRQFPDLSAVELLVYGEILLMVSQTCVLYEVLEKKTECSHWCLRDQYYLKDDKGYTFPVLSDADCRFYIFNSRTLSMIDDLSKLAALAPGAFRLEMRRASAGQVSQVVSIFKKALENIAADQKESNEELRAQLEQCSPSPFTKCHYYRGVE
jgi:putative protease